MTSDDECHQRRSPGDTGAGTPKAPVVMTGAFVTGADDETRTRDIHLGKVVLYQLSYVRMHPTGFTGRRVHHST